MNTSLKNITNIVTGYPFRGKIESNERGFPVIQMKDIKDGKLQRETIVRADVGGSTSHTLLDNDILCAGKAKNNYFILLDGLSEQTVCSPHFFRLRITDKKRTLPEYLYWVLNSDKIQNFLQSKQVGTTTFSIRKETLLNLEIPMPPIHEQAQLIKLAQAVEANTLQQQKIITNNQQLMNGITQQLFKTYGSNTHG